MTTVKDLQTELTQFQDTLVKYINNKLDYMQQEITMLNTRIDNLDRHASSSIIQE